jgi:hypothetical protein
MVDTAMKKLIPEDFNTQRSGGLGDLLLRRIETLAFLQNREAGPALVALPESKPVEPRLRPHLSLVPK